MLASLQKDRVVHFCVFHDPCAYRHAPSMSLHCCFLTAYAHAFAVSPRAPDMPFNERPGADTLFPCLCAAASSPAALTAHSQAFAAPPRAADMLFKLRPGARAHAHTHFEKMLVVTNHKNKCKGQWRPIHRQLQDVTVRPFDSPMLRPFPVSLGLEAA